MWWRSYGQTGDTWQPWKVINQSLATDSDVEFKTINTGYGAKEIGQSNRTTDNMTFATVNTGQGANELYKTGQESISFGTNVYSVTKIISAMAIHEKRTIYATGTSRASIGHHCILQLPAGGLYIVGNSLVTHVYLKTGGAEAARRNSGDGTEIDFITTVERIS
jgi:hypothetical protein